MAKEKVVKRNIDEYRPYFLVFGKNAYDKKGKRNIGFYDRSFYCQENYMIHTTEKQALNCSNCSKRWFKPEPNNKIV